VIPINPTAIGRMCTKMSKLLPHPLTGYGHERLAYIMTNGKVARLGRVGNGALLDGCSALRRLSCL